MNRSSRLINWEKMQNLLPVVVQDADTLMVLMLGYMNREAYEQTLSSEKVTFYSRSKNRLWVKGETSGHYLQLVKIHVDCDGDALLILARPEGYTCHLNQSSCFGSIPSDNLHFLKKLEIIVQERAAANDEKSYTSKLIKQGIPRIAQKVGEEGVEVALAAVGEPDSKLCAEAADLLYHVVVLLASRHLALRNVVAELENRHKPNN